MSPITPQRIRRFLELPRMAGEVWQGGLVRMPTWVQEGPDGKPYRPWGAVWVSLRTGQLSQQIETAPEAHDHAMALEALLEMGLKKSLADCRPERIEVTDDALAAYLRGVLGDTDTWVSVVAETPAIKAAMASFGEYMAGAPLPPDALAAPGVTVERMRAFAEAAKAFYLAAPWRHLSDQDLIHVEAPKVDPGLRYLTVLGGAGITFGLGFYEKPEDFEAILQSPAAEELPQVRNRWSMWYGPLWDLPFGDADLWEAHGLPVAGEDAYPMAVCLRADGEMRRPDAAALADLKGLLRALADTSEDEIDRGRWTKEVLTHNGPETIRLALPALLEPLDAPSRKHPGGMPDRRVMERTLAEMERFMAESDFQSLEEANAAIEARFVGRPMDKMPSTATTPLEKAQDLVFQAFDARGRRRIQLARKALELSADCADAYVLLAEQAASPEAARDLYAQGVAAGERALGPETFEDEAGHFWGTVKSRPYMRARLGLAQCLEDLGHVDEAIGHYQELLRLNPNDNQGVRDILLPTLLATGRDAEAGALLQQYEDDPSATWKYGWALWTFRQEADSPAARARLHEAVRCNRHVSKYLTGRTEFPDVLPDTYAFGSEEEAVLCADDLFETWQATPGAEAWLMASKPKPKPKRKPQTRRRR